MARSLGRFFSYCRSSLADADRMMPDAHLLQAGIEITQEEAANGRIHSDHLKIIARSLETAETNGPTRKISICPRIYRLKTSHAEGRFGLPQTLVPLWVPAILDIDTGVLVPDYTMAPWIPRNLLEPLQSPAVILGTMDSVDAWMGLHPAPMEDIDETISHIELRLDRWKTWLGWGLNLLEWVSGFDQGRVDLDEYERSEDGMVFSSGSTSYAVKPLLQLYDCLIRDVPKSKTATWLIADDFPDFSSKEGWDTWAALRLHVAHIPGLPPLSPSQRWTLRRQLQQNNPVYPVNGPPGTGKSTLLAQMIIQSWAHAALRNEDTPPTTMVTSTSNPALMRIMELFERLPPGSRWTDFEFGLAWWYVPPSRQDAAAERFSNAWTDGRQGGIASMIDLESTLLRQKQKFLTKCQDEMGVDTLAEARKAIHAKLLSLAAPLGESARMKRDEKNNRHQQEQLLSSLPAGAYSFEHLQQRIHDAVESRQRIVSKMTVLVNRWTQHLSDIPVWNRVLEILPHIRMDNQERNRIFFTNLGIVPSGIDMRTNATITDSLNRILREMKKLHNESKHQWDRVKKVVSRQGELEEIRDRLIRESQWAIPIQDGRGNPDDIWEETRDSNERTQILIWSVRYWECIWLISGDKSDDNSFARTLKRHACLAPCMVSTLHSAPRFFVPWKRGGPVYDLFDQMVIDEAGQISIETAVPLFPLAKQVIVAGDPEQIEPIWGVPEGTDIGNLMREGLLHHPDDFVNFSQTHLSASGGNLQKRVDMLTVHPLWLTDQHRSHPELVQFCNRLSYDDRLRAKRSVDENGLPAFGFAHVPGEAKFSRGSWVNPMEAEAIVEFIVNHAKEWQRWYGNAKLEKILGVVTPFVQQSSLLYRLLEKQKIRVQVGTVHAFQGSEKPIILFSPTQSISESGDPAFFDRRPNFLNVAVSRARDSFWVIGNLNDWCPANQLPSGLLSSFLMRSENSWFRNVKLPVRDGLRLDHNEEKTIDGNHAEIISSLLKRRGDIHVAMPYVRKEILEREGWLPFFKQKCKTGRISFYMNRSLVPWVQPEEVLDVQDTLIACGVDLYWTEGLMDSMIWCENVLIEFSLPLLGMDNASQFRYYEGSQVPWLAKKIMARWTLQSWSKN